MSIISTTVLALSMSADAFAVSVSKGAAMKKPSFRHALRTGALFGIVEAITPLIGWIAGLAASRTIQDWDHWVAFAILGGVGVKLIYESFQQQEESSEPKRQGLGLLLLTAIGTSIDALAVGVSLAFLPVNIWISAAAIGTATFTMVTIGIMTGHYIGCRIGKLAEFVGGLGLIAIGSSILLTHLGMI